MQILMSRSALIILARSSIFDRQLFPHDHTPGVHLSAIQLNEKSRIAIRSEYQPELSWIEFSTVKDSAPPVQVIDQPNMLLQRT